MKRFATIAGVFLMVIIMAGIMAGCSLIDKIRSFDDPQAQTNAMTQRIVSALDEKDEQAIRDVLSPKALGEVDDLDEGIEYIFSKYRGRSTDIEFGADNGRGYYGPSGRTRNIQARATITTDEETYRLYYELWTVDSSDSSAKGIYRLTLVSVDEVDALFAPYVLEKEEAWDAGQGTPDWNYGATYNRPGIYHPGWDKDTDALRHKGDWT
jgi:hypothetical protein